MKTSKVLPPVDDNVQLSVDDYRQKLYELIATRKTNNDDEKK